MANTSSSSSTTAASSLFSGLRSSGLMSGLDTETIVKQMAAATKNRITKQQQKLDKLSWKQSSYRDVISKMSTFKDTYLNSLKVTLTSSQTILWRLLRQPQATVKSRRPLLQAQMPQHIRSQTFSSLPKKPRLRVLIPHLSQTE